MLLLSVRYIVAVGHSATGSAELVDEVVEHLRQFGESADARYCSR